MWVDRVLANEYIHFLFFRVIRYKTVLYRFAQFLNVVNYRQKPYLLFIGAFNVLCHHIFNKFLFPIRFHYDWKWNIFVLVYLLSVKMLYLTVRIVGLLYIDIVLYHPEACCLRLNGLHGIDEAALFCLLGDTKDISSRWFRIIHLTFLIIWMKNFKFLWTWLAIQNRFLLVVVNKARSYLILLTLFSFLFLNRFTGFAIWLLLRLLIGFVFVIFYYFGE